MDLLLTVSFFKSALRRAVVLIVVDDIEFTVVDTYTQQVVALTADALCEYAVELDIVERWGEDVAADLRTIVRALRMRRPGGSFVACKRLAERFGLAEGIAEFTPDPDYDASCEYLVGRVEARAEMGLSDKSDW